MLVPGRLAGPYSAAWRFKGEIPQKREIRSEKKGQKSASFPSFAAEVQRLRCNDGLSEQPGVCDDAGLHVALVRSPVSQRKRSVP